MTELEKTEGEIKVLQAKLELLKEMENHKSPAEEAYKAVYGWYPPTTPSVSNYEDNRWSAFQSGYSCGYGDGLENSNEISKKPVEKQSKTLTESWMNKPMNELVEILNKNPPDCLKFQMGKTLEDRIYKWWTTCFTTKCEWSMEECLDDLLDIIELFLPREQSHEGTQNVNTIFAVEAHNELLQKIKSKLRNKKI